MNLGRSKPTRLFLLHHPVPRTTTTEAPTCDEIACPDNYAPVENAWDVECRGGRCSVEQCCDAMCACFACPDNFVPIDDAVDVMCDDGECTKEQCCNRHDGDGGERE